VTEVWLGICHALDDGHLAGIPHGFHAGKARVQPVTLADVEHLCGRNSERLSQVVVATVLVRHHRVESVVATAQGDDHHDAIVDGQWAGPKRFTDIKRQRCRCHCPASPDEL
jgi:hypothetical protein